MAGLNFDFSAHVKQHCNEPTFPLDCQEKPKVAKPQAGASAAGVAKQAVTKSAQTVSEAPPSIKPENEKAGAQARVNNGSVQSSDQATSFGVIDGSIKLGNPVVVTPQRSTTLNITGQPAVQMPGSIVQSLPNFAAAEIFKLGATGQVAERKTVEPVFVSKPIDDSLRKNLASSKNKMVEAAQIYALSTNPENQKKLLAKRDSARAEFIRSHDALTKAMHEAGEIDPSQPGRAEKIADFLIAGATKDIPDAVKRLAKLDEAAKAASATVGEIKLSDAAPKNTHPTTVNVTAPAAEAKKILAVPEQGKAEASSSAAVVSPNQGVSDVAALNKDLMKAVKEVTGIKSNPRAALFGGIAIACANKDSVQPNIDSIREGGTLTIPTADEVRTTLGNLRVGAPKGLSYEDVKGKSVDEICPGGVRSSGARVMAKAAGK